ncbi:sigma-54-dependent Fis family transcriptional regulator [candidate division KSB1 bacterium]|nr:sigma-54-dependent Fis family transcriptional regulator [candidate division KSB1 bacterium]
MILIIDDDIAVQKSISLLLGQNGFLTACASFPEQALKIIEDNQPDLIILDLNFGNDTSGREGLGFLEDLKSLTPKIPVILITAWASISLAVEGMKKGAFDFLSKPWENKSLLQAIDTALKLAKPSFPVKDIKRKELDKRFDFSNMIGNSPQLLSVLETIGRVSGTDAGVLILGESGTGKELVAEAIHKNSTRKNNPFVKVNLGGLSVTLFESELFGHKKGAFTDAYSDRVGRFELGNGGTIFLDEIGDLDTVSQVKLLRVLQDKTYQVLGDSHTKKLDVRVVCATNRNLHEMVEKGTFREDLFYRINLITLKLPPLRERRGDILLLVKHFLDELKTIYRKDFISVNSKTMRWLESLHFPGNVRELKNLVERTWLLSGKSELDIADFEKAMEKKSVFPAKSSLPPAGSMTLDQIEKEMIQKSMDKFNGNLSKVAKALGLSRGTLYRRIEKYGIPFKQNN